MIYVGIFIIFMAGVATGSFITCRLLRAKKGPRGEELTAEAWECTNCGFTSSIPLGHCPVCKMEGERSHE